MGKEKEEFNYILPTEEEEEEEEVRMIKLIAESPFNQKVMQLLKDYDEGKWEIED